MLGCLLYKPIMGYSAASSRSAGHFSCSFVFSLMYVLNLFQSVCLEVSFGGCCLLMTVVLILPMTGVWLEDSSKQDSTRQLVQGKPLVTKKSRYIRNIPRVCWPICRFAVCDKIEVVFRHSAPEVSSLCSSESRDPVCVLNVPVAAYDKFISKDLEVDFVFISRYSVS